MYVKIIYEIIRNIANCITLSAYHFFSTLIPPLKFLHVSLSDILEENTL